MNMDINKFPKVQTNYVLLFGNSRFPSQVKIVIPLKYKDSNGKMINHKIGILIGLKTMASWDIGICTLELTNMK